LVRTERTNDVESHQTKDAIASPFQLHQPEMQIEVRVDVAFYNAILQPLQVVLGLNYFKIGEEANEEDLLFDRRIEGHFQQLQEAGEEDAAVEPEPMVVGGSSGEVESSGLCEASLRQRRRRGGGAEVDAQGKLAGVVEWWVGAPQKDLAAYVVQYPVLSSALRLQIFPASLV
jgi:hypothetical protein